MRVVRAEEGWSESGTYPAQTPAKRCCPCCSYDGGGLRLSSSSGAPSQSSPSTSASRAVSASASASSVCCVSDDEPETWCCSGLGDAGVWYEKPELDAPLRTDVGDPGGCGRRVLIGAVRSPCSPASARRRPSSAFSSSRRRCFVVLGLYVRWWWRTKGYGRPCVVRVEVEQAVGLAPDEVVRRGGAPAGNADALRECVQHLCLNVRLAVCGSKVGRWGRETYLDRIVVDRINT